MLGTLLGNYRVVDKLGAGGMGVVYVGHHEALGRRVVMKVLQRELPQLRSSALGVCVRNGIDETTLRAP